MSKNLPSQGNDPARHWRYRELERRIHQTSIERIRVVSSRGRIARKRKKYVNNTERANYRALLRAVMNDLTRQLR